jgi:hypothetical protein
MLAILDRESLDIMVLKTNKPRFVHTAKIDFNEYKKSPGEFTAKITSALKLALSFYQEKFAGGESIEKIVFAVLCADYDETREMLGGNISGVKVEGLSGIDREYKTRKGLTKEEIRELNTAYLGAIGCVSDLKDDKKEDFAMRFSLVPDKYYKKVNLMKQVYASLGIFALISIFILGLNAFYYLKVRNLIRRARESNIELVQSPREMKEAQALNEKIRSAELSFLEAANFIRKTEVTPWHMIISDSLTRVPEGLKVTTIGSSGAARMAVNGMAFSEESIYEYINRLRAGGYFSSVELKSSKNVSREDGQLLNFKIGCVITAR